MLSLLQAMSATNPDDDLGPGEDEADKSQRKRERERQRRTEMAGAFNDLAQLLSELDPDNVDAQSSAGRRRRRRGSDNDDFDVAGDASGMTRLLLINRATAMLRSLQAENADLRGRLLTGGGGDDKVCRDFEDLLSIFVECLPWSHMNSCVTFEERLRNGTYFTTSR